VAEVDVNLREEVIAMGADVKRVGLHDAADLDRLLVDVAVRVMNHAADFALRRSVSSIGHALTELSMELRSCVPSVAASAEPHVPGDNPNEGDDEVL
jgi:hypothetical protein